MKNGRGLTPPTLHIHGMRYYYGMHTAILVSQARPFTDSCPPGWKGLVTSAHTFGDYPHDSWGTVLPRVLFIGSCGFFTLL